MDSQYGGIQWIQHHNSAQHSSLVISGSGGRNGGVGDMKTAGQLIIDPHPPCEEDLMASANSSSDYMATEDEADDGANIDQIAAENLIFMARDGQMVTDIITHNVTDENGSVVVTTSDGEQIDCDDIMHQAALIQQHEDAGGGGVYTVTQFTDTTPQMVTEEVITDDWVQHQGEERVEIQAEQLISNSQVLLDMEVPLPTVQDEYTALRPYPCDFCSRRFRKKASLMNHMVAHQNDRPHLCKLCGSRFMRRQDLINHLKAHAEEASPEPPLDDADFIHFVSDDNNHATSHRNTSDHYYEQDWSIPEDSVTIPSKSSRKNQQQLHQQQITSISNNQTPVSIMGSNSNVTALLTPHSPLVPSRGRISRLRPKEDTYVVNVGNNCDINSSSFSIDGLSVGTDATSSLNTQDIKPALRMQHIHNHQEQHKKHEPHARNFPIIDDNKPFVCQQCGLAFSREKAMLSHTKTHRNDSPFECPQCNELFWDQNSLQEHQKTHQFEESNSEYDPNEGEDETQSESESEQKLYGEFYCSECGMSFHRQDLLRRHTRIHAKDANQQSVSLNGSHSESNGKAHLCCSTCGESFEEALDLLAHAEIHARYPPFKCVLCGESFFEEPTIKKHLQSQHSHELTENSCILCGKECRDRKALIKHAWDHSREKCHSCSKCGKNFHNKARLKRHMASHRDKSVQCDVCHEEFPDGRTLSNHRHSHSTTSAGKLFPCHECGKTFGSRSSQQIHVRIHTGERPYGCRFCWKAFADGGTLRKHERIHTGEKPYACSVCPRAFNQRVVLREHIRSHHSGLDAKRGTYYCTVCGADLSSSSDLIQHLIQHSDMNTAMQRQPVTGPRKYKRRRKLKPHEIARLKREVKQHGSDIDLSDFDMDNVDELLAITETNTSTENALNNQDIPMPTAKATKQKTLSSSSANVIEPNNRKSSKSSKTTSSRKKTSNAAQIQHAEDFDLDVGLDTVGEQHKQPPFNSTSSDKIWSTKTTHEDSYKSLFSNLETSLQSFDTLVVGSTKSPEVIEVAATSSQGSSKRKSNKQESSAQRTKQVQIVRNEKASVSSANTNKRRKSKSDKAAASVTKQHKGPQMIHTGKQNNSSSVNGGKKKPKVVHSNNNNKSMIPKTVAIVDDYDIISPALHPPKQISCSPLHIKQEQDNHQMSRNHHLLNSANRIQVTNQNTRHTNDLYDAHLLLEASGLRTDLDEILRSPLKSYKLSNRQRFTSESSSQFLNEQSEEEQHMIKIEPTSPDLREIVNGVVSVHTTVSLNVTPQSRNGSKKSIRSYKSSSSKGKYFEFADDLNHGKTFTLNKRPSSSPLNNNFSKKSSKSARTEALKSSKTIIAQSPASYLDYSMVDTYSTVSSSSPHSHANSFASISAVVSAADANAAAASAAAAQQNPSPTRKPQRYFECEMCSAVFFDRAQLLDHVPIHI